MAKIFVVDDQKSIRMVIAAMLEESHEVETFETAEACLMRCVDEAPDMFLLDVHLPGMDGRALCKEIRGLERCKDVPVVFITACDSLEDALAGYDAGANDYVVKPFEQIGLNRKVENLLRITQENRALLNAAQDSDDLVTLLQSSLDDNALVIRFLRNLTECMTQQGVIDAVLHIMHAYHLAGAVQIRLRGEEETVADNGQISPMLISIVNHVRNQGRIFEFKRCSIYNFERISILLTSMPVDNSEQCGRIRDSFAIIAETAEARLLAIQALDDRLTVRSELGAVIGDVSLVIDRYNRHQIESNQQGQEQVSHLLDVLLQEMAHLGLSEKQEARILELIKNESASLVAIYDFTQQAGRDLQTLQGRLAQISDVLN
jgi:CheY-like chemotaxis protein